MAVPEHQQHGSEYRQGILTLIGSVAMGTGVVIGAGIFVLTGHLGSSLTN